MTTHLFCLFLFSWAGINESLRFDVFQTRNGLASNTINSVLQDQTGYLWIGTDEGLNRFDGHSFKLFEHNPKDQTTLSENFVWKLYEDRQGRLWVATYGGGVNLYHPETESFTRYQHEPGNSQSLGHNRVWAIFQDHNDQLWFGLETGLSRFIPETSSFVDFVESNITITETVRDLHQDRSGRYWVATEKGLYRYQPGKPLVHYEYDQRKGDGIAGTHVSCIFEDQQGQLWFGTLNGVCVYQPETDNFKVYRADANEPNSLAHNQIRTIFEDKRGQLWIGAVGGLSLFDKANQNFRKVYHDTSNVYGLTSSYIRCVAEDAGGNIWLGTFGAGLAYYSPEKHRFRHLKTEGQTGLINRQVYSIHRDRDDRLWVGTQGGLSRRDGQEFRHYQPDPQKSESLSDHRVWCILEDRDGDMWFGTSNGLERYLPEQDGFAHIRASQDGLLDDRVYSLAQDWQGYLWIGTRHGLNRFDPDTGTFQRYRHEPEQEHSLSDDRIYVLKEMKDRRLWIGTEQGLNIWDSGFERHMSAPNGLSHNRIWALHQDQQGRIWVGTGMGLNLFLGDGSFRQIGKNEGLKNNSIYGICSDEHGNLWLSTNKGVTRFHFDTMTFFDFETFDGLLNDQFNGGSYFQDKMGHIYFGGPRGVDFFHPKQMKTHQRIPNLVFTELLIANKLVSLSFDQEDSLLSSSLDLTEELVFSHQDQMISFEFSALDFIFPQKIKYAYRLLPYQQEWIETDASHRRATFTHLGAGSYRLEVKTTNFEGYWGKDIRQIRVKVLPAPWLSPLAIALYALLFVVIIWWFLREQQLKLRQQKRIAEQQRDIAEREHHHAAVLEQKVFEKTKELNIALEREKDDKATILRAQEHLIMDGKMVALGTLTSGIAHEFNNPNNFINGAIQNLHHLHEEFKLFLYELAGHDNQEVVASFGQWFQKMETQVKCAEEGVARINEIVGNMQSISPIDEVTKAINILDSLRATIALVGHQYSPIKCELALGKPIVLMCKPAEFNQVFLNLIINGMEAIRQKDPDAVHDGLLNIRSSWEESEARIVFEDNGCGMTEHQLLRIFEAFYTTREVGDGVGLGLFRTWSIMKQYGAKIEARSKKGEGSTFILRFPRSILTNCD